MLCWMGMVKGAGGPDDQFCNEYYLKEFFIRSQRSLRNEKRSLSQEMARSQSQVVIFS